MRETAGEGAMQISHIVIAKRGTHPSSVCPGDLLARLFKVAFQLPYSGVLSSQLPSDLGKFPMLHQINRRLW